jgi:hypothetical protein
LEIDLTRYRVAATVATLPKIEDYKLMSVRRIAEMIREWYREPYVPPPETRPGSMVVFLGPGHHEQPLFAKGLKIAGTFWLNHWKWIITTSIAVAGIWIKGK